MTPLLRSSILRSSIVFGAVGCVALVSWQDAEGRPPTAENTDDVRQTAAVNARLRFGTDIGGRFFDASAPPYESPNPEHVAERQFEKAMARLIEVALDHPGTDAAERARCVLDAAERALEKRVEAKKQPQPVFCFGSVPVTR